MFINECFYVVYCKVSSSQPNASFFVQTVEEFGDDEPRVAYVSGYVVHHDEEFHLAFTILEKGPDEVPEPFFDVVQKTSFFIKRLPTRLFLMLSILTSVCMR